MLNQNIINTYSNIISPVEYTNGKEISFDGSQIQFEFFNAWGLISDFYKVNPKTEISFLELGAYKGLWAIAFCEFCKLNNIKGHYVTVTLMGHDPNNLLLIRTINYLEQNNISTRLINEDTLSENVLDKVKNERDSFNIVFIDAGYKYHEVINDINKFAPLVTDMLLFHDIRPIEPTNDCGVYKAIQDSNITLDVELTTNSIMGIGIKYI